MNSSWIIYTYGNSQILYNILMSVGSFFGSGAVNSLVGLAGAIAFFFILIQLTGLVHGTNGGSIPYSAGYFFRFVVLCYAFVNINVSSVVIFDEMTNQPQQVIQESSSLKLPWGLIAIESFCSQLTYDFIQIYERYFETGSSGNVALSYSKSGMVFGSNFIASLPTMTTGDIEFEENLKSYFQNCGLPIANGNGGLPSLTTATDILNYFATNYTDIQSQRFVSQVHSGQQAIATCLDTVQALDNQWNSNSQQYLAHMADITGYPNALEANFIAGANATANDILQMSGGASSALKQSIAMNMLYKSMQNGAVQTGNTSLANAVYDAQQFQQYQAGGLLSSQQAARVVPVIKAYVESVLFLLYPLMVFYALVTASFGVVTKYIKWSLTIAMIPLVYEVLSAITYWYSAPKSLGILGSGGFNLLSSSGLYNFNATVASTANYISITAPIISYAIVSGSDMAITGLFSHVTDPARSISSTQGALMSTGSDNMGNVSMDVAGMNNLTANKFNNAMDMTSGVPKIDTRSAMGNTANIGGKLYEQAAKSTQVAMPINIDYSSMAQRQLSNQLSQQHSESGQLSKQYGDLQQKMHDASQSVGGSHSTDSSSQNQVTKDIARAETLAGKISTGLSAVGSGAAISATEQNQLSQAMKEMQGLTDKYSTSHDAKVSDAFKSASSLNQSSTRNVSEVLNTSNALNKVQSEGVGISSNLNGSFQQYLHEKGLSSNNMSDGDLRKEAEGFVNKQIQEQFGINAKQDFWVKSVDTNQSQKEISKLANSNNHGTPTDNIGANKAVEKFQHKVDENATSNKVHNAMSNYSATKAAKDVTFDTAKVGAKVAMNDVVLPTTSKIGTLIEGAGDAVGSKTISDFGANIAKNSNNAEQHIEKVTQTSLEKEVTKK